MLARSSKIFPGVGTILLWGRAFSEKFYPGAGLLTTSKKFPGGLPGDVGA